jgi:DNA-binding response OmpR family regulator
MVDDDEGVLNINERTLSRFLGGELTFITATSLGRARQLLEAKPPIDLVLLDLMLPDGDGRTLVEEIRRYCAAPILMLTGRRRQEEITQGLLSGGNDYITKPYDNDELCARVRAMLSLVELSRGELPKQIVCGPLRFDLAAQRAFIDGAALSLTQKEYAILYYLTIHRGRIVPVKELYEAVWELPFNSSYNTLQAIISKLRLKLRGSSCSIDSFRREGYQISL